MAIWNVIGQGIVGVVEDFFATRRETAAAKLELEKIKVQSAAQIEVAKAQAIINMAASAQDHSQEWERILASQQGRSWKDEYILLLFSIPLIMAFIPSLAPYVTEGFKQLEAAPDWYLQVVLAGAAVAYGLRQLLPSVPIRFGRTKKPD